MRDALIKAGIAEGTTTYDLLMAAAKTAVGGGLGGAQGAAAAFNADANNRQLHKLEIRSIRTRAAQFARELKGGAQPSADEIRAAERRLADAAFAQVQLGAPTGADAVALAFLRRDRFLLPGDPSVPGATVGYAFEAPLSQRANANLYADGLISDWEVRSFYFINQLNLPSQAQVMAAAARAQSSTDRAKSLTWLAGFGAAAVATAPLAPPAITACLANITLCGIEASEIAFGSPFGPAGIGANVLAARAGVKNVFSAEQANAQWVAGGTNRTAAWTNGTSVLQGELAVGTRVTMYVDELQAIALRDSRLGAVGGWATLDNPATSASRLRQVYALPELFKPSAKGLYVVELEVTKPMPVNVGFVGPQRGTGTGGGENAVEPARYSGGGTQIQLLDFDNRGSYFRVLTPPKCLEGC